MKVQPNIFRASRDAVVDEVGDRRRQVVAERAKRLDHRIGARLGQIVKLYIVG